MATVWLASSTSTDVEGSVRIPWRKKTALVEWDLTGDIAHGFGAVVYLTAAPAIIVHEFQSTYGTEAEVTIAVDRWISTESDRYRLDKRFQDFKALARSLDDRAEAGNERDDDRV